MKLIKRFSPQILCFMFSLTLLRTYAFPSYAEVSTQISIDQLFEDSIIANPNRLEHYYIKGIYGDVTHTSMDTGQANDALKIETLNGEPYIYLKLWLQMLESYEIHNRWQVVADKTNSKFQLVSWKGIAQGGGWTTLDKIKSKISFTIDQSEVTRDGVKISLPSAPIKFNGRTYLPLSAIESLFGYSVLYKENLLIFAEDDLSVLNEINLDSFDQISAFLSSPPQQRIEDKSYFTFKSLDDKSALYIEQTENQNKLWLKKVNKTAKEVKMPPAAISLASLNRIENRKLYYMANSGKDTCLYAFDTTLEKHLPIANLTKELKGKTSNSQLGDISTFESKKGTEILFTLKSDEVTIGNDTLYKLENGKIRAILQSKGIHKFKMSPDGLVVIENTSPYGDLNGLAILKDTLKKPLRIENPKWSYQDVIFENGQCYVTASPYPNTLNEESSVFKLDLKTAEMTKLSPAQIRFWALDKLYYLDAQTRNLKSIGLNGGEEETLIETPIMELEIMNHQCYYTLADGTSGIYKFDIKKGSTFKVLDAKIHTLYVHKNVVGGISKGYRPGFYLVKNGKTQQLLSGFFETLTIYGDQLIYVPLNSNTVKFQKF